MLTVGEALGPEANCQPPAAANAAIMHHTEHASYPVQEGGIPHPKMHPV